MLAPTRVLLLGDVHGNLGHIKFACESALAKSCDVILQLGDFGYWPHMVEGQVFLDETSRMLYEYNLQLVFIDGNHENFNMLWGDHVIRPDGFWQVWENPNLLYAPRGHRWTWADKKFLSLGGAYSIDKYRRLKWGPEGVYWWSQEMITMGDVYRAMGNNPRAKSKVDVMLSHDVPANVDIPMKNLKRDADSQGNRKMLQEVMDFVQPKKLYHGHMHMKYDLEYVAPDYKTQVMGLGFDERPLDSWAVLDLENDF